MVRAKVFGVGLAVLLLTATALAQKPGWPKELVIAEVPVESAADYASRYAPFLDYLKGRLGIPVRLFLGTDYTAVMLAQAQGQQQHRHRQQQRHQRGFDAKADNQQQERSELPVK